MSDIIHRDKFMQGLVTPEDLHRQYGMRSRCASCGGPPVIRVKLFMPLQEFIQRNRDLAAAILASSPNGQIPTTQMFFGTKSDAQPAVKYADVTACSHHKRDLEVTAAKAPSHHICEIDRGIKNSITSAVPK